MKTKTIQFIFLCSLLISYSLTHANDTTARVGAGGLIFTVDAEISMDDELLEISAAQIRVTYEFSNSTAKNISTIVAFPMPQFSWNPGEAQMDQHNKPMTEFQTWVNGERAVTRLQTKAYLNGLDITQKLYRTGLNDLWIVDKLGCGLDQMGENLCIDKRIARAIPGLADKNSSAPLYTVQQTAWWTQSFKAKSSTKIVHAYPSSWGGINSGEFINGVDELITARPVQEDKTGDEACMKEGAFRAINERAKKLYLTNLQKPEVSMREVEYILGTGRNWKGGVIKNFTLRIKK